MWRDLDPGEKQNYVDQFTREKVLYAMYSMLIIHWIILLCGGHLNACRVVISQIVITENTG